MSLITAEGARGQGYQAIPLPRAPGDEAALTATMVRRSPARRSTRAVLYVHCLTDPYVQPDLAAWYLERGFHFYVADLRAARPRSADVTLAGYFRYLDRAARQVRDADGNRTVLVSAHRAGAVITALWCHARRGDQSADALILADPDFGPGQPWLYRLLGVPQQAGRPGGTGARPAVAPEQRPPDVLPRVQRKVRRGLDISCPVLVMSPSAVSTAPGARAGLPGAAYRAGPGARAGQPARLGPHVTSVRLPGPPPGLARPDRAARWRLYDELSRWLGAYISADVRDQLLLPLLRQPGQVILTWIAGYPVAPFGGGGAVCTVCV